MTTDQNKRLLKRIIQEQKILKHYQDREVREKHEEQERMHRQHDNKVAIRKFLDKFFLLLIF